MARAAGAALVAASVGGFGARAAFFAAAARWGSGARRRFVGVVAVARVGASARGGGARFVVTRFGGTGGTRAREGARACVAPRAGRERFGRKARACVGRGPCLLGV